MFRVKCVFVSDLHGKISRYESLFHIVRQETPDAVFLGGDLLPQQLIQKQTMEDFIERNIVSNVRQMLKDSRKKVRFFIILGNDDPRIYEQFFIQADKKGIITYIHNKTVSYKKLHISGYAYVPPTPFLLKDWERYDISEYVDIGAVSPEKGTRTVDVSLDEIKYSTIAEDLGILSQNAPVEKTIFLFHSPPYHSLLDTADLHGKTIDHAPLDIHIGSIAIQRFIKNQQPLLTLHGHVHESVRLTGQWKEQFGRTFSFSAAHDGPELALVRFDTDNLKKATRELIVVS